TEARCGTHSPCFHRRRPCNRWVPWREQWTGLLVDDVVTGLAEGSIRPAQLFGNVYLTNNRSIALYAGLTSRPSAMLPESLALPPAREQECKREPIWRMSNGILYPVPVPPPAVQPESPVPAASVELQYERPVSPPSPASLIPRPVLRPRPSQTCYVPACRQAA